MCADLPDYKNTLNLPKTDFPMRAGLPLREPGWLERWERIGIYGKLREKKDRKIFALHDGPPYANGHLHIGHALNKIIKDMIVRSHQMMGFDSRYVPGWDCHGLPIEWKIEERYRAKGKNKDDLDIVSFRQECRGFAEGWVNVQREEFKRLGVTGAWDDPYLTMAFHAERVIAEEFMKFLMNGTLYQGSKPVMWSPVEKTALAEAEVEYHDRETDAIWVKFPVVRMKAPHVPTAAAKAGRVDEARTSHEVTAEPLPANTAVVIWTTTPWTIPQNRAICFGPEISYGLYEITGRPTECWVTIGDRYILADDLVENVFAHARLDPAMYRRVRDVTSGELESLICGHPLRGAEGANGEWDHDVPLLPGGHVTDAVGTGFVHTAPSHGDDDYQIGLRHGLKMTFNILDDSSFRADLPFFAGKAILKPDGKPGGANGAVMDKLVEIGAMLARQRITISDAYSWRSKAPVIRLNRPQWFVDIDKDVGDGLDRFGRTIRQRALTEIDNVEWTPRSGRNRLHAMMEVRPDWVLSRQRAWGVPLACFTKKNAAPGGADFLLRDPAVNARILEAFESEGADTWYRDGAKERFLSRDYDPDDYEQVFDILDVWFDSGSTHAFVLRDREDGTEDGIADVYMEGTDQHRGWFHSSLLQSCGTYGRAPYRAVVTHGFTLDEKGMKMSKSLGNTILPEEVVGRYGADILRLWVAQTDYTADQRIGSEILKGVADSYRRLRNTMRFILGSLGGFDASKAVAPDEMPELERWVLHRLTELDRVVRDGYVAFDFQKVWQSIFGFATLDLSAFYFDIRKDALYCDGESPRRLAALTVLDVLYRRLTAWLAPILVFTMEEVWLERNAGDDVSVHLRDFPETPAAWRDDILARKWATIRQVRRVVTGALEKERRRKTIGSSLEAAPVVYLDDAALLGGLSAETFADLCITSDITISTDTPPAGAFKLDDVPGVSFVFAKANGKKCQRCWKILPDVGTHDNAGVCARCNAALGG